MAELADAPDLGSGGNTVQVQVLSPAPIGNPGYLLVMTVNKQCPDPKRSSPSVQGYALVLTIEAGFVKVSINFNGLL